MKVKEILEKEIFNDFVTSKDKESDFRKLFNLSTSYFYNVLGIYNEEIENEIEKHINDYLKNKEMKYQVKVYINGELDTLVQATPEQIEKMNKYLLKLYYGIGGNENE